MKFALLAICLAAIALPAAAQDADGCHSYPDVPIAVTPVFDQPRYDFTHSLANLQAISSDHRHSIPHYHEVAMGITRYEPIMEFNVPMVIETSPDGLSCAYIKRVEVTVGYRDVIVYIASEIPRDSCAFDETMGHEQKHVAVNRELLHEFAPMIEARLRDYMRLNGVFRTRNAKYAEATMQAKLQAITDDMIAQMQNENIARQRQVDSPQEYARLSHVCNGQLSQIADFYRRTGR
jgi:hypothetical protein